MDQEAYGGALGGGMMIPMPVFEEPMLEFFEYDGPLPEALTRAEAEAEAAAAARARQRQEQADKVAAAKRAAAAALLAPEAPRGRLLVEIKLDCDDVEAAAAGLLSPTSMSLLNQQQQQQPARQEGPSTLVHAKMWVRGCYGDAVDIEL